MAKITVVKSFMILATGLTFEDVQQGLADNSINLIDVRTSMEVKTLGKIPTANNLPSEF